MIWSWGDRILFIGDASRGFSPMLQNGAAQAFEDAYVLGELFKAASSGEEKNTIAKHYEERRSSRAQWVKETSDKKIVALAQKQVEARNAAVKEKGAPNVFGFKVLMQENP